MSSSHAGIHYLRKALCELSGGSGCPSTRERQKIMNQQIQKILIELYALDPKLQAHEAELVSIISKLADSKPSITVDKAFAERLRSQLMQQEMKQSVSSWQFPAIFTRPYALVGALVVVLLVGGAFYTSQNGSLLPSGGGSVLAINIEAAGESAFGSLKGATFENSSRKASFESVDNSAIAPMDASRSSSSDKKAAPDSPVSMKRGAGGSTSMIAPMPDKMNWPTPEYYKFVYTGGSFTIDPKGAVYKRIKGNQQLGQKFVSEIGSLNFGFFNPKSFSPLMLQDINLVEQREHGYQIHINIVEGMISINPSWERLHKESYTRPLEQKDTLSNDDLIAISNQFMNDHGITTSAYGKPIVLTHFGGKIESMAGVSSVPDFIPDIASVLYPLLIDGKEVYDGGVNPTGLQVTVDIRERKVLSVYNLATRSYQKSDYPLETDTKKLIQLAIDNGMGVPIYYSEPNNESPTPLEVKLGKPEVKLMQYWKYDNTSSEELVIPALAFPILNKPTNLYLPDFVFIPLVKEILDDHKKNEVMPQPVVDEPLPLMPNR